MNNVIIVAIVFGTILSFAAIICGTILSIFKMRRSGISGGSRKTQTEEAKVIQEIYQGLSVMEARIESLETILMEGQEKERRRQ